MGHPAAGRGARAQPPRHRPAGGHRVGRAVPPRVLRRTSRARPHEERRPLQGLSTCPARSCRRSRTTSAVSWAPRATLPSSLGATGLRLRPSNFGVIWESARLRAGLTWVRFHDLHHFAATTFASTGASTKEIMSRGGWKSVAMVVCYEHASEERDALLALALNQVAESSNVVPIPSVSPGDRAVAREEGEVEGEVLELPPLTSENEEKCSGGETRTHNLAVNSRLLCH